MILRYRFGLDGGSEKTLEDVGVRFDVVTLLVIAEDRALLRHYRGAFVPG